MASGTLRGGFEAESGREVECEGSAVRVEGLAGMATYSVYVVSEYNGFASARSRRGSRHQGPDGARRTGVGAMLGGWLYPRLRRTEENLWDLPVTSGQPSGLNGVSHRCDQHLFIGTRRG